MSSISALRQLIAGCRHLSLASGLASMARPDFFNFRWNDGPPVRFRQIEARIEGGVSVKYSYLLVRQGEYHDKDERGRRRFSSSSGPLHAATRRALQVVSSAELDHGHRDRGRVCFPPSSVKWAPRICLCYILASKSESITRLST